MFKWKGPWFLVLLFLTTQMSMAFAQERTITGKVEESGSGKAISGATIKLQGTDIQTISAPDGTFELTDVPEGDLNLEISKDNYGTSVEKLSAGTNQLLAELTQEDTEEIVITGQATSLEKKHLAHSVSKVSGKDMTLVSAQTFTEALQGKVAGANIQVNSGAPGGGIQMKLRGVSTINGRSEPLYVVDGVIMTDVSIPSGLSEVTESHLGSNSSRSQDNAVNRMADFNVNDIESIQILKGASAAAIYGAKASNGVVIITTKKGEAGKTRVSLTQRFGIYQLSNKLGARKYKDVEEAVESRGEIAREYFVSGKTYDHEEELFGNTDLSNETNVSISGGTNQTDYYASILARKDAAILLGTGHEKQSLRLNIGHAFSEKFQIRAYTNLIHSLTRRGVTNNQNDNGVSHYFVLANTPSFFDQRIKGSLWPKNPFSPTGSNALQTATLMSDKENLWRMIGSLQSYLDVYSDYEHRVQFNTNVGVDRFQQKDDLYFPPELFFEPADGLPGTALLTSAESLNFNLGVNLVYTYEPESNLFRSIASAGFQHEERELNIAYIVSRYLNGGKSVVDVGSQFSIRENRELIKDQGFYFQEELILLDDSLTLTGAIRGERSSVNGDPNEVFFYPKASVAYNIPGLEDVFDRIKVRFAYGETGNQPIYGQKFTPLIASNNIEGNPAITNGGIAGDPNIKPERQREFEGGLDLILLDNAIALEFTVYQRNITDLLLQRTLAPSTGFTTQYFNGGGLRNRGIEIALEANPLAPFDVADLEWIFRTTFTLNRSMVTDLPVPAFYTGGFGVAVGTFRIEEGKSPTQIYGWVGLDPETGPIETNIGDIEPTFRMSFYNQLSYNRFNLSFLVDWQQGSDVINLTKLTWDGAGNSRDYDPHGRERFFGWLPDAGGFDFRPYVEDATFIKLREVTLSYNLPDQWAAYLYATSARISLSGRNLLVITDYWGLDPEVSNFGNQAIARNIDVGPYPPSRSFWLSFDVRF